MEEILPRVRALVAECLAQPPERVTPASRLVTDLGADSLDFLDLVFALERAFGVPMREGELDFLSRLDFASPEVMNNGALTEQTLAKMEPWLPALRQVPDRTRVTPGQIFELITVETLCLLVERKRGR